MNKLAVCGPKTSPVAFVSVSPSELDEIRGDALTGPVGATFRDLYLHPLGLRKEEVLVGHVVLAPNVIATLKSRGAKIFVALGRLAKVALDAEDVSHFVLPHPAIIRKKGDKGELARKLKSIRRELDAARDFEAKSRTERTVPIAKTDSLKRIVYAVVLDPYQIDSQGDWVPPNHVEETAHNWLAKSRLIGLEHASEAKGAVPVESWIVPYPSPEEYQRALKGEPHKVHRQKFGQDTVHSGAWILGTRLSEAEWALYEKGEIDAYSIGGFGKRTPLAQGGMPEVSFIDLVEAAALSP